MGTGLPPVPDDVPARRPNPTPATADSSPNPPGLSGAPPADLFSSHGEPATQPFTKPHGSGETSAPDQGPRAAALAPLPRPFGRYRLLEVLGHGGMGTVYLAEDSQLGRQVALKVPRLDRGGGDDELVRRFYREAHLAATFHHPHLCPVYDVGQVDGVHFLTMPLLRGEPLSKWLRRDGRLPTETAALLACQIARAMAVAHRAGVVHRDLKPSNIMVNERREPIVLDFGLSRHLTAVDPQLTSQGVVVGTPLYAPPEQLFVEPEALGPACDVYSLGVTLYEMLTGTVPFRGTVQEICRQVLTRDPEPPSRHRADLDPRLNAVCLRALAKDPLQRFASMEEFAAALEGFLRNEEQPILLPTAEGAVAAAADSPNDPSAAETKTAEPRPHQDTPRRWPRYALAALSLALAGVLLWFALASRTGSSHKPFATDPFQPGTRWVGSFRFLPPQKGQGDVILSIRERDGPRFKGVYATEGGKFAWNVTGEVDGQSIRWELVEVIREAFPTGAAGNASVQGTYEGESLQATYQDADSAATLQLRLADSVRPSD